MERARQVDPDIDELKPLSLVICGQLLYLGGDAERGAEMIERAIRSEDYTDGDSWFYGPLALARVAAGDREGGQAALQQLVPDPAVWSSTELKAHPDGWPAAYFLDLVSREQFLEHSRG